MQKVISGKGAAKRAAREQARATREAAEAEARRARLAAQAAQMQQEGMIARQRAAEAAKALQENQIEQTVDVEQVPTSEEPVTEEGTRRRRQPRDVYRLRRASGLQI